MKPQVLRNTYIDFGSSPPTRSPPIALPIHRQTLHKISYRTRSRWPTGDRHSITSCAHTWYVHINLICKNRCALVTYGLKWQHGWGTMPSVGILIYYTSNVHFSISLWQCFVWAHTCCYCINWTPFLHNLTTVMYQVAKMKHTIIRVS